MAGIRLDVYKRQGEVWVESEYKEGSTFYVFVPSGDNLWNEDE